MGFVTKRNREIGNTLGLTSNVKSGSVAEKASSLLMMEVMEVGEDNSSGSFDRFVNHQF